MKVTWEHTDIEKDTKDSSFKKSYYSEGNLNGKLETGLGWRCNV